MTKEEKFKIDDEEFTIKIEEYPHKKFNFDGIYDYRVKNNKGEEIAYLAPGKVILNGRDVPHRVGEVNKNYRNRGIFTFILNKAKEMNDTMTYQLATNIKTKNIYENMGYKTIKIIRNKIINVDYYLLKLK